MKKRAVIYARQSLDAQEGIDRQLARCRALAESKGWEVVDELVDNAVSASKSRDAAEYGRLVQGFKDGSWDVVIAAKLDRLARRVKDVLELADMGLQIVTLEGDIDTTSDVGRFQATLLASLAELEVARKGARHKEAHAARAKQGIPRVTKRPYGWQVDGVHREPREAEHLRIAITNIIAGNSIAGEARRMNQAGQRTPAYKTGSGGREFSARKLTAILDRPRVAGLNTYLGVQTDSSVIEAIVDTGTWEEYLAIRKDPSRLNRMPGRSPLKHWMSSVAYCPCGNTIRAATAQARGKRYAYYRCDGKGGGHSGIAAATLEYAVADAVFGELRRRQGEVPQSGAIRALRAQKTDLSQQIDHAAEATARARTDASQMAARRAMERLEDEYLDVEGKLRDALNASEAEDWSAIAGEFMDMDDLASENLLFGSTTDSRRWLGFLKKWGETDVSRRREIANRLVAVTVLRASEAKGLARIVITPR